MKNKSLRYYYFISVTTVLVASVLIMGLIQTWLATSYFRDEKERPLIRAVANVQQGFRSGELSLADYHSLRAIDFMARTATAAIFITDANGVVLFGTGVGAPALGTAMPEEVLHRLDDEGTLSDHGRFAGVFATPFYVHAAQLQGEGYDGYVFAAADAQGLSAYLSDTITTFVLSAALVLLVASVLAFFFSTSISAPLRRISDAARRFGEGDYSARVPVQGDDELSRLAITFNQMANSFEATDSSRRSFMGNIAHELRTPMTTIKGFIDGMLDGTIPVEQRDKYLAIVSDEVGRLARLTKNMLDISRIEAGEYTPNQTVFDIWGPVASVFVGAEQRLEEKNLQVEGLEEAAPLPVLADEDFVYQVLYNLVDNAIKFADEGGTLSVRVLPGKNAATVGIRNSGSGIPADTLPHVFDRFYKADASRGLNTRGAGLGLHISKVLLNQMNGRIWAESDEDEGWTEFLFTLPCAPRAGRPARPRGGGQG
ncbi:MAG: sensor histidine kinase [Oscillospiraceae bacterium]